MEKPNNAARAAREDTELVCLLDAVFQQYGHDFRQYAPTSLKRRVQNVLDAEGIGTIPELQVRLLAEPDLMARFVLAATVNVTSMFRDPYFFQALRAKVVPIFATWPLIRIWVAGCSTGEEVYAMAILLEEEGLYDRSRIYGTDINEAVIQKAKMGIFRLAQMQEYTTNYILAGGKKSFSKYYTAAYGNAVFHPALRLNMVFAQHNLVTDSVFNEFHLILCRNVLIYFNTDLKQRVYTLLDNSLALFGVLGFGKRETIQLSPYKKNYQPLNDKAPLYQKMRLEETVG